MHHTPWLVLCLALVAPAFAGDVERLTGPVPAEDAAFQAALQRFADRAAMLEAHAEDQLLLQRDQSLARLRGDYDVEIARLEAVRRDQRAEAMRRFEGFLQRYDGLTYAHDVRLRLAELYYQDAQEDWISSTEAYNRAMGEAGDDLDRLAELEEQGEPEIDLSPVVRLLDRVIKDNVGLSRDQQFDLLDVAYYMLGFCYAEPSSAQFDRAKAAATFRQLVSARPDSDYADSAHLILGNYAFDENRFADSIPEFQAVIAQGPERRLYLGATYQLAWARYKLNEYDEALKLFTQILDASVRGEADGRRRSDYAGDSVVYVALSLSDQADQQNVSPLERARAFFAGLPGGERTYEWEVYKEMAESLVRYSRQIDAVEVYTWLQQEPRFAMRSENPDFQNTVVKLLSRGYGADLKAAGEARLQMTRAYGEGSPWWTANTENPDAQARARRYIESSLLEVAKEVKVRAQEGSEPALYSAAADKYREYLDKFPMSDDYFANQFQLADALFQGLRYREAIKEYEDLIRNERFHPYGDISVFMAFRSWDELLRSEIGSPDQRYANAKQERAYTSVGGVEMPVYALEDTQRAFISAADRVLQRTFGPPVEEIDTRAAVEKSRVKIEYLIAQILYFANRYDEARPRLQAVIEKYPSTDDAAWAANMLLNSYINEKDTAQVRRWSREFATRRLGATASLSAEKGKFFQDALEKSTFDIGLQASAAGDHAGAAEAFLAFAAEFPKSPNVPIALMNAASNFDRAGQVVDANRIYERFITEFPDHPDAKPYYFNIASNYEATYDLEKAVRIYGELVKRFPTYERSPDALYMVGFLKEGLGDKLGAAQTYEAYAKNYPDTSDREEVVFRAGRLYEQVDEERALRFYRSYLQQFGTANADHAIAAQARIGELLRREGKDREASAAFDEVIRLFDRLVAAGTTVGPEGRDSAAAAAFRPLKARHDKILAYKLSGNEEKDAKLVLETLKDEVNGFQADATAYATKYLSFEYTIAAVYLTGSAQYAWSKLGLSIEPPKGLDEVDRDAYWELLEEQFFPLFYQVEESSVATLQQAVTLARDTGRHCAWVDQAQDLLNRIKPEAFPAAKRTLRGEVGDRALPELKPIGAADPSVGGGP